MSSYLPFEHYPKPLHPVRYLNGMLSGTILKNLVGLVLQETHTLNEMKILNILESNNSSNEIKMPQTEKGINTKKKKKVKCVK